MRCRNALFYWNAIFVTSLAQRRLVPEQMDQPDLSPVLHERALRGLHRINRLSNSAGILWRGIRRLVPLNTDRPVKVLDLASGSGDLPIALAHRAAAAGLPVQITGWDISPVAVEQARRRAALARLPVAFEVHDLFTDPLPRDCDLITCSLFLHHLSEPQAEAVLRRAADVARIGLVINDLRRSPTGLLLAHVVSRIVSRSPVVHFDAPQSVRAAYTINEVSMLANRAGLAPVEILPCWPYRFLLLWRRPLSTETTP